MRLCKDCGKDIIDAWERCQECDRKKRPHLYRDKVHCICGNRIGPGRLKWCSYKCRVKHENKKDKYYKTK